MVITTASGARSEENQNAEIAERAGSPATSSCSFVQTPMRSVRACSNWTRFCAAARNKLTEGRGNLISRSEQPAAFGARASKSPPMTIGPALVAPWKRPSEISSIPCPGFLEKTEAFRSKEEWRPKDALKMIMSKSVETRATARRKVPRRPFSERE